MLSLITRLDILEKRSAELEIEVASQQARWRLVTGNKSDTGEIDRRAWYLEQLSSFFSEDEIRTICFEVGVNFDTLPASGAHGKARELMIYLGNRNKLERLYDIIERERPFLFEGDDIG